MLIFKQDFKGKNWELGGIKPIKSSAFRGLRMTNDKTKELFECASDVYVVLMGPFAKPPRCHKTRCRAIRILNNKPPR